MIVHGNNPVASLTHQQVVDIYTGKVTRWSQVGGTDAPITVVPQSGRSFNATVIPKALRSRHAVCQSRRSLSAITNKWIKTVVGNPDAIGYVSIGSAAYEAKHGTSIKLLPMDRVEASVRTVGTGTFPLSRSLSLVTHVTPTGIIKQFIDFACSDRVYDLVSEQHFVTVSR